jgi:hypothetical protein
VDTVGLETVSAAYFRGTGADIKALETQVNQNALGDVAAIKSTVMERLSGLSVPSDVPPGSREHRQITRAISRVGRQAGRAESAFDLLQVISQAPTANHNAWADLGIRLLRGAP